MSKSEANKYKVYKAIMEALPHCRTTKELENKLQLQGIQTEYKYKGQTTEKQGISFKIGEDCFKGSKVDRQFSLSNLEKSLEINRKQILNIKQETGGNFTLQRSIQIKESNQQIDTTQETFQSKALTGLEKIAEILLKPEENFNQSPNELLKENKRKKKKQSRGLHH